MWLDDFNPHHFRGLTLEEQITKCHAMAAEAEGFAVCNMQSGAGNGSSRMIAA